MLNEDHKSYIDTYVEKWVSKAEIWRMLKEEFWLDYTDESARKTVSRYVNSKSYEEHRWNAINNYSSQELTLPSNVKHVWHKTELEDWSSVSAFIKNNAFTQDLKLLKEEIIEEMKSYAPKYTTLKRNISNDWHLLVVNPADVHIWKLCKSFSSWDEYNQEIAVQRVREWIQWILDKSAWYNIDKIIFVAGNDILHVDGKTKATTAWTPQDTDSLWFENFMKAKSLYIEVLEKLSTLADVEYVYCPSNHDYVNWFFLTQAVEAWFTNNENISFDSTLRHRKYTKYWKNMLNFSHGDWCKEAQVPLIMATEEPIMWSETKHRYSYLHHVHHKIAKEYQWVTVEYVRSCSWTDTWHKNKWYIASKAIEWFLHHKEQGQVARFVHNF